MTGPVARPRQAAPPAARPRPTNGAAPEWPPFEASDADAPSTEQWMPDVDELVALREGVAWRTLADVSDEPPAELLLGMLERGPNALIASGGVGKGTTGAWMIHELQGLGAKAMIYDPENRPREWARRVSGLGGDRHQVAYLQPADLPRPLLGRPLWDVAPHLGTVAAAAGADVLFVDSILPAIGVGEDRLKSDAQVPYLYVAALDALEIPSVSFGHPPKGQPDGDPFGSMAWVSAMRLTWSGTRAESSAHQVRWRPRKRNERGHIAGVLLTFDYSPDGRLAAVTREDDEESTRQWLLAALVPGAQKVADLADELSDQVDDHVTEDGLRRIKERIARSLRRMEREGLVAKEGGRGGSGVRWGLKWAA
jgi:hypothetical protein